MDDRSRRRIDDKSNAPARSLIDDSVRDAMLATLTPDG
jgi:hypothetical protein